MSLIEEHRDLAASQVANSHHFGEAFVFESPMGFRATLIGQIGDISALINPETGLPITGRQLTVVVSEADFVAARFNLDFDLDENYLATISTHRWRACDRRRDRTLKLITLFFEPWRD